MASKSDKLEAQLGALRDASQLEDTEARNKALKVALKKASSGAVVALAARICGEAKARELEPDLARAFNILLKQGVKRDPGCPGKSAIVKALRDMQCQAFEVYEAGALCFQMEPVWGGSEDSASGLRALSGAAIGELNHPDASLWLSRLLADPNHRVRSAAAESLGNLGDPTLLPLLLYAISQEGGDSEVLGPLLKSAFYLGQEGLIPWVAPLLHGDDTTRAGEIALALGESRYVEAFKPLNEALTLSRDPEQRQLLMTALALLRRDVSLDRLLEIAEDGLTSDALMVIKALEVFSYDEDLKARLWDIAEERGGFEFHESLELTFGRL